MKTKLRQFETAYGKSLQACLSGAGEVALGHGYELGRRALREGLGVMDIVSVQRNVVQRFLKGAVTADDCRQIVGSSHDLFAECLAPFELTHRGFLEAESLNSQLEAANRELESFSYSVSHDLRGPLRAIDGYSRMILRKQGERFDDETLRQFGMIRSNVQTMGHLIDDLLGFARLGKQEMSKTSLDMEVLVNDVWQNLLTVNPGRNMTLHVQAIQPGMGDRSLMREVFSNLLGNAVKFTRHREMARIEVGSCVNENETVYYVRDNGIGFDMKYHDRLFGVFQRLHSSTDYEGTGIGLALVQRVIHRHGGRVWAESKPEEGACFYFTLPRTDNVEPHR